MTTRTNSQSMKKYISLKKKLCIKHNLVLIFKCDQIHMNGSYTNCNGNVRTDSTTSARHHKAILP